MTRTLHRSSWQNMHRHSSTAAGYRHRGAAPRSGPIMLDSGTELRSHAGVDRRDQAVGSPTVRPVLRAPSACSRSRGRPDLLRLHDKARPEDTHRGKRDAQETRQEEDHASPGTAVFVGDGDVLEDREDWCVLVLLDAGLLQLRGELLDDLEGDVLLALEALALDRGHGADQYSIAILKNGEVALCLLVPRPALLVLPLDELELLAGLPRLVVDDAFHQQLGRGLYEVGRRVGVGHLPGDGDHGGLPVEPDDEALVELPDELQVFTVVGLQRRPAAVAGGRRPPWRGAANGRPYGVAHAREERPGLPHHGPMLPKVPDHRDSLVRRRETERGLGDR